MDAQTRYCKKCGTPYTLGENFCNKCGERLNTYNETPNTTSDTRTTFPEYENNRSIGTLIFIAIIAIIVIVLIIVALNLNENSGPDYSRQYENTYDHTDTTPPEPEETFETGTVTEDGVYENKTLGIKCSLPGWTYFNNEELNNNNEQIRTYIKEKTEKNVPQQLFSDMMAIHPNGTSNINIVVWQNNVFENFHNEKSFLEIVLPQVKQQYEQLGFVIDFSEITQIKINGISKTILHSTLSYETNKIRMFQIVHINSCYCSLIGIVAQSKEELLEICNSIYFE